MNFKRLTQILKYGWRHSNQVKQEQLNGFCYQMKIFFDILYCFVVYKMWSNQYLKEKFYLLDRSKRNTVGKQHYNLGVKRDIWQADFIENRKFLNKYSAKKYELPNLREKRNKAYANRYNMGRLCFVEYDVELTRQHYLPGTVKIGDNVLLAKHVFIDYSGDVFIGNDVQITDGVVILSHDHKHHNNFKYEKSNNCNNVATKLIIGDGAVIGTRAVILSSCNYIGKYSRIGSGAVVTKDIPDYAVAVGVPAKIIKIVET